MTVVARDPRGTLWCAGLTRVRTPRKTFDDHQDRIAFAGCGEPISDADVREMAFSFRMAALI
jgi:hypothetical protein